MGLQKLCARDAVYRSISKNLTAYLNASERNAGRGDFDYANLSDNDAEFGRQEPVAEKGFHILPCELFQNVRARAAHDEKFDFAHGDTLLDPGHMEHEPFEAIVSNPPRSIRWDGDANPLLINDPRFSPARVLAPKSKGDLAFTMHILSSLAVNGTAANSDLADNGYNIAVSSYMEQEDTREVVDITGLNAEITRIVVGQ